jgi:hypothetical protein
MVSNYLPYTMDSIGKQVDDLLRSEQVDLLTALYRELVENASNQSLREDGLDWIFGTDEDVFDVLN